MSNTQPRHPQTRPSPLPLLGVVATLVLSNVMANQVLPSWAYIPWNCAVAVAVVVLAVRADGCETYDLGLATRRVPSGLRWGAAASGLVLAVYLIGVALPFTRDLFHDDRADVDAAEVLWRTLVAIPFGTVLMEEITFRGALPAMFRRRTCGQPHAALRSDIYAALLFGAWHVLPTLDLSESNETLRSILPGPLGVVATVAGAVVATGVFGMLLSQLRNRSDSLVAPSLLHWSTNSIGYVIAWLVQR